MVQVLKGKMNGLNASNLWQSDISVIVSLAKNITEILRALPSG